MKKRKKESSMKYRVGTFRDAGLEAKWSKSRGARIIVARNPNAVSEHMRKRWWWVDRDMWATMQEHGVVDGFDAHTILGDLFSI